MVWTKDKQDVYLYTNTDLKTIRVTNSIHDLEFHVPMMNTYDQLARVFTLFFAIQPIRFRIHHLDTWWELCDQTLVLHDLSRIHLHCTERDSDFYIRIDLAKNEIKP